MQKIILLTLTSLMLFSCNQSEYQNTNLNTENQLPSNLDSVAMKAAGFDRYIIEADDLSNLEQEIKNQNGSIVRQMQTVSGFVTYLPAHAIDKLKNRLGELKVTPDIEVQGVPTDVVAAAKPGGSTTQPSQSIPWGISRISATDAHAITRGEGISVCVVDSGIDKTHPDLINNIIGGRNFVVIKGSVDPTKWNDDNGHGSHVAGTIAAEDNSIGAIGVAPKAKLYGVKVLNQRGSGYLSDVADGVTECVRAGAKVINMSLGASGDPTLDSPMKTAILNAQAAGVIVVVAAGNEGQDIKNTIPAGYPSVIAVAAIDNTDQFASWSNFGLDSNDVSAPGVSIYSTWKGGQYNTISGTSMASPHVAGVAALHLSAQSAGLKTIDLGFSMSEQGLGLIDALGSAQ